MEHKVSCAVCGKKGIVKIDNKSRKILNKNWYYFHKTNLNYMKTDKYFYKVLSLKSFKFEKIINEKYDPKAKPKLVEHWECEKCAKE